MTLGKCGERAGGCGGQPSRKKVKETDLGQNSGVMSGVSETLNPWVSGYETKAEHRLLWKVRVGSNFFPSKPPPLMRKVACGIELS